MTAKQTDISERRFWLLLAGAIIAGPTAYLLWASAAGIVSAFDAVRETDKGAWVQAAATVFAGLVGSVLSGAIAAVVAVNILLHEEKARENAQNRKIAEDKTERKAELTALADWVEDVTSLFMNYLTQVGPHFPFQRPPHDLAVNLRACHASMQVFGPPRFLLMSVAKRTPTLEKPLDQLTAPVLEFVDSIRQCYILVGTLDNPEAISSRLNAVRFLYHLSKFDEFAGAAERLLSFDEGLSQDLSTSISLLRDEVGLAYQTAKAAGATLPDDLRKLRGF